MIIEGHLTARPRSNHPDPQYWLDLREQRANLQQNQCGTCWRSSLDYVLELHHRCYCHFGNETLDEVILLCRSCHEAITSRIRSERFALGSAEIDVSEPEQIVIFRPGPKTLVTVEPKPDEDLPRFRPASRYA